MSTAFRCDPPAPIQAVARCLETRGVEAWLVGPCLRKFLLGVATRDFEILCDAPLEALLDHFERAVPIPCGGHAVLSTSAGVCELRPLRSDPRGAARSVEDALTERDFSIHAIAWDLHRGRWCDPLLGLEDLRDGMLRGVGDCEAGFRRHPIRMLRAGRLVATLGLKVDAPLRRAMSAAAVALGGSPKAPMRREIETLLGGQHAGAGLRLLHDTGVEAQLAPGCDPTAPDWVDALPRELPLRLAAWLFGTDPQVALGPLRFGEVRSARVARLIARHPIDGGRDDVSLGAVRRLLARTSEQVILDLLILRRAECESRAVALPASLEQIREHLERARNEASPMLGRHDLALSGREIMALLDIPPGPKVGEIIDWLIAEVERDPQKNSTAALRKLLEGVRTPRTEAIQEREQR